MTHFASGLGGFDIKPLAVIFYDQDHGSSQNPYLQGHGFRPGMFFNIVDGFLHDAEQLQFHPGRQPAGGGNQFAFKLKIGPQLNFAAEAAAGGGQS
jgi:hypothetical protein